jgi:hypothetical protein
MYFIIYYCMLTVSGCDLTKISWNGYDTIVTEWTGRKLCDTDIIVENLNAKM